MEKNALKRFDVPRGNVTITDEYCLNALEKETDYLLALDENRLLAGFYQNAGLKTPFVRYGGWESELIGGHTLGHFMTALAQASADPALSAERREKLSRKLAVTVKGLETCQNAGKSGLIWGAPPIPGGIEAQFINVEQGKTDIKREAWVPWYTLHKILAGLLAAYRFTGDHTALKVASALGDWTADRALKWDDRLQTQVLSVEYGGMNDALYELYSYTRKPEHARAAHCFDEEKLFDRVIAGEKDCLEDLHANMTIPKILGALNRYFVLGGQKFDGETVDAARYLRVAERFFGIVTERHTYITGGNSEWEHFGADYVLDKERTNCNCETCNVYNMMKLARGLFLATGEKKYADYYDNAFTNSILSSQNPETGMTTYFQPMASGYFKVFSTPFDSFWCCTGTGMENFTKLGEGIYYVRGKNLFVERYLSSLLETEDVSVALSADFPRKTTARFTVRRAAEPFLVCFRIPDWAAGEVLAKKNGVNVHLLEGEGHAALAVKEGDEVELTIPVEITLHGLPDGKDAFAFRCGGAVLSADLGAEDMAVTTTGVDVLIPARRKLSTERIYFKDLYDLFESPSRYLVREGDGFALQGGDIPVRFGLHYRRYRERYALYLRLREGEREPEEELCEPVDAVQPGYGQYETDDWHDMAEERSEAAGEMSRRALAGGYFSYDFAVAEGRDNTLTLRLSPKDNGKQLRVLAVSARDSEILFDRTLSVAPEEERVSLKIALKADLIARLGRKKEVGGEEKTVIRLRFEGSASSESPRLYEVIRTD